MFESYDELDPGIRDVVRLLREAGHNTIDSGDGVSKKGTYAPGEYNEVPHVVIRTEFGMETPIGAIVRATIGIEELLWEKTGQRWTVTLLQPKDTDTDIFVLCLLDLEDTQ